MRSVFRTFNFPRAGLVLLYEGDVSVSGIFETAMAAKPAGLESVWVGDRITIPRRDELV